MNSQHSSLHSGRDTKFYHRNNDSNVVIFNFEDLKDLGPVSYCILHLGAL